MGEWDDMGSGCIEVAKLAIIGGIIIAAAIGFALGKWVF